MSLSLSIENLLSSHQKPFSLLTPQMTLTSPISPLNPTESFYYYHNCAHIQAYFQYNIANYSIRRLHTLDWLSFLQRMILLNHKEQHQLPLDQLVVNYQWKIAHAEEGELFWTLYNHVHSHCPVFDTMELISAIYMHRHISRIHFHGGPDTHPYFPLDRDDPSDDEEPPDPHYSSSESD